MSNLSVAWTSSTGRSLLSASVTTFRFLFLSYAFLEVKKVRLRFPRSWKTVPPPLRLRARGIPARLMAGKLHSVQGFWWRPMTTAGRFLHSSRTPRCCRSTLASIQSSRARFWYTSVDWESRTSPESPPSEANRLLQVRVWHLQTPEQPLRRDNVLLMCDIMVFTARLHLHMLEISRTRKRSTYNNNEMKTTC